MNAFNKSGNDFKEAATKIKPNKWIIHHCSICNYPCGYVFSSNYEHVGYDSGCDCVSYENIQPRSWDDLAAQYNVQNNEEYIKEMNKFWGFE